MDAEAAALEDGELSRCLSWLGQRARRAPRVGSPHEMAWAGVFRGGGFAWGDGAADCSCTIRGDVACGYRPPEEAAAGEENTLAAPSRQRRGSRRPRPSTERRSPSPGRDAGVEEGAAAVPLEAARWGPSPSWTEQRRRSKGAAAASLEVTQRGTADHLRVGRGRASRGGAEWRHCLSPVCWVQEPGDDPTTGGRTGDATTLWVMTKIQLFRRQQEDNNYSGGVGHSDVW